MSDTGRLQKRFRTAGWLVLSVGALTSAALYRTVPTTEPNQLVEGFQGSKAYRHELEAYGGKLNLVFDDLAHWFASLWQGERLAFTVACSAIFVAFLLFFAARRAGTDPAGQENTIENRKG